MGKTLPPPPSWLSHKDFMSEISLPFFTVVPMILVPKLGSHTWSKVWWNQWQGGGNTGFKTLCQGWRDGSAVKG